MSTTEGDRGADGVEWVAHASTAVPLHTAGAAADEIDHGPARPSARWRVRLAIGLCVLVIMTLGTWFVVRPVPVTAGVPHLARGAVLAVGGDEVPVALPIAPKQAVMGSANGIVTMLAFGRVPHIHEPMSDVQPAHGDQLLAFQLAFALGDTPVSGAFDLTQLDLGVSVDGSPVQPLPLDSRTAASGQHFVASVPAQAHAVDLVLQDSGIRQSISLLTGAPAAGNIEVLRRTDRDAGLRDFGHAVGRVQVSSEDFTVHLDITVRGAYLKWFSPVSDAHASATDKAFVYVSLCFQGQEFTDPKTCHSFRNTDLFLTPSGGKPIQARETGTNRQPYPVFEVPADFRNGVLTVRGSESSDDGWHMTITAPYRVNVSF